MYDFYATKLVWNLHILLDGNEMTDEQRLAAYEECIRAASKPARDAGLGFIASALRGNPIEAGAAWVGIFVAAAEANPKCSDVLTEQQRQVLAEKIAERRKLDAEDKIANKRL